MRFDSDAPRLQCNDPRPMPKATHKKRPLSSTNAPAIKLKMATSHRPLENPISSGLWRLGFYHHTRGPWNRSPHCKRHIIPRCLSSFGSFFPFWGQSPLSGLLLIFINAYLMTCRGSHRFSLGSATSITIFQSRPACGSTLWAAEPIIMVQNSG